MISNNRFFLYHEIENVISQDNNEFVISHIRICDITKFTNFISPYKTIIVCAKTILGWAFSNNHKFDILSKIHPELSIV